MEGANQVALSLDNQDIVIVVDVTGSKTNANFVIEKCRNKVHQILIYSFIYLINTHFSI